MEKLTCARAKQIDLVDYLASLRHQPMKVKNQDYWYLSPLRKEQPPPFKVNRELYLWFGQLTGEGGDMSDCGIRYVKCTVAELLQRSSDADASSFSFHPHPSLTGHLHTVALL